MTKVLLFIIAVLFFCIWKNKFKYKDLISSLGLPVHISMVPNGEYVIVQKCDPSIDGYVLFIRQLYNPEKSLGMRFVLVPVDFFKSVKVGDIEYLSYDNETDAILWGKKKIKCSQGYDRYSLSKQVRRELGYS